MAFTKKTTTDGAAAEPAPAAVPLFSVSMPGAGTAGSTKAIPLFPDLNKDPELVPVGVRVKRIVPEHAYLGQLAVTADEEMIRAAFGGGVYEITAVAASGRPLRGGTRSLQIDGDPKSTTRPAAAVQSGASMAEMMQWVETRMRFEQDSADRKVQQAQAELEAGLKRREQEVNLAIQKTQAEAKARIDEAEAKAKLALDLERERNKMERESERERLNSAAQQSEKMWASMVTMQRDSNANMVSILTATQNKSDPAEMLARGIELAGNMGKEDPNVAITKAVTDGIGSLAQLSGHDVQRSGGGPMVRAPVGGGSQQQSHVKHPLAKNPPPQTPEGGRAMVEKLKALLGKIHAEGHNPADVIDKLLEGELVLASADDFEDDDTPAAKAPPAKSPPKEKRNVPTPHVARGRNRNGGRATPTSVAGRGTSDGGPATPS